MLPMRDFGQDAVRGEGLGAELVEDDGLLFQCQLSLLLFALLLWLLLLPPQSALFFLPLLPRKIGLERVLLFLARTAPRCQRGPARLGLGQLGLLVAQQHGEEVEEPAEFCFEENDRVAESAG